MAGFFQQVLKGATEGLLGDIQYVRDFQHASKTFTTNGFGNAPKLKYLFHVYFEVNESLIASDGYAFPDSKLPGLLVKNISLPKFNVTLAEMNQYNRTRYVQTKLKYDPVQISFHDDNLGAVKMMWYNFYRYYYNDTVSATNPMASSKNTYSPDVSREQHWGYLGEPSTNSTAGAVDQPKAPYFKSIKIYGFNQHNFSLYTLVNPIIERFEHDTYDYYQPTGIMENKMTVRYEAVTYSEGAINGQKPEAVMGFGSDEYYDKTPSPIMTPRGNRSILGQGGLVDAADGVLKNLSDGNYLAAAINTAKAARTFKNPKTILSSAKNELLAGALAVATNPQTVRGLFNVPAPGAGGSGTTAQSSASTNPKNSQAPTVP